MLIAPQRMESVAKLLTMDPTTQMLDNKGQALAGAMQWALGLSIGIAVDSAFPPVAAPTHRGGSKQDDMKDIMLLMSQAATLAVVCGKAIEFTGDKSNMWNSDSSCGVLFAVGLVQSQRNMNARVLKVGGRLARVLGHYVSNVMPTLISTQIPHPSLAPAVTATPVPQPVDSRKTAVRTAPVPPPVPAQRIAAPPRTAAY
jgi:hypothetical protein